MTTRPEVTQAAILAGGLGLRLRPAVPDLPKVLAPVAGRPFLEHLLERLRSQGIKRVVMCVGYRAEEIAGYFRDGRALGMDIRYSLEDAPLGTGGALRFAARHLDDTFLLLNGDTLVDLDIGDFARYHRARGGFVTLAGRRSRGRPRHDAGYVLTGRGGRVTAFTRGGLPRQVSSAGPAEAWVCCGWYMCERRLFDDAAASGGNKGGGAASGPYSLETGLLLPVLGSVYVYPTAGRFIDIGTPERYRQLKGELERT